MPSLLAYVLAMGLPITDLKDVDYENEETLQTELSASDKAKKIFMDSKKRNGVSYDLVTYITEWSDCFDPNTSSKNNRASVYIKSITFPRKNGSTFPTASYTFPICIGPGKANKLFLEDMFASEIELFKKEDPLKFWDNSTRTFRSIYVDILCSMQDQPERRSGLCLMMGNSRMFPRFGYSCNYQSIYSCQRSCRRCDEKIKNAMYEEGQCESCLNWNLDLNNPLSQFNAPEHYPMDCPYLRHGNLLQPRKISNSFLVSIHDKSYNKFLNGDWNKKNVHAYLGTYGVNTEYINKMIDNIENGIEMSVPSIWKRNLTISDHVETIMHLLFLGITKTLLSDIHSWLQTKKLYTKYLKFAEEVLLPLQKLNIEWCKIIPYGTGKFGGHVSENYLGMARILKWFMCILNRFVHLDEIGNNSCLPNLIKTTNALYAMLSRILQRKTNEKLVNSVERHVKYFLNQYVDLDSRLNGSKNISWIKKYNFLSLLNLKEQMQNFGPLLNLWEGGIAGEKIISTMKPEIKTGLRKHWQKHLFNKWMRKYFFNTMKPRKETINYISEKYGSINEIQFKVDNKLPFVARYNNKHQLYIKTKQGNIYIFYTKQIESIRIFECTFLSLYWEETMEIQDFENKDPECLVLPLMDAFIHMENINNIRGRYYIITENWLEFDLNLSPIMPRADNNFNYNVDFL